MELHTAVAEDAITSDTPEVETDTPSPPEPEYDEVEVKIDSIPEVEEKVIVEADEVEEEAVTEEEVVEDDIEEVVDAESFDEETSGVISKVIKSVSDTTTTVIDSIKNVSEKDAKKAAAASIGVWGAATGIGWAMQRGGEN